MLRKIFIPFICLLFLLLPLAAIYQFINIKLDEKKYPPIGQLIDIGGYKLHLTSLGTKGPAVVIDQGLGGLSYEWDLIQKEVAKFTQVITYDRAGYGWSESSPYPRTSKQIVFELHELLEKANIPKPYILVGHSFGGMNIQLYAATYPEDVLGLVLVDSGHEEQAVKLPPMPNGKRIIRLWSLYNAHPKIVQIMSFLGITRFIAKKDIRDFKSLVPKCSDYIANLRLSHISTTKHTYAVNLEANRLVKSQKQLQKIDRSIINNIPCYVIMADKPGIILPEDEYTFKQKQELLEWNESWKNLQKDIASKFNNSHIRIAENSDHSVQWKDPELIIKTIKELIVNDKKHKQ